jgi:hypothetical protein
MSIESLEPDPAAVFGAALSLWQSVWKHAETPPRLNLSECYNGGDEFMRIVMRIATAFELWASDHVFFDALDDVWPYLLEDRFGEACLSVLGSPGALLDFDVRNCLRVALWLRLPVKFGDGLPVPIDVVAANPVQGSPFHMFRIQTVRRLAGVDFSESFTVADDPFDDRFGPPFFALCGVGNDGLLEHIADRATYAEAVRLAGRLAPGIGFSEVAHS